MDNRGLLIFDLDGTLFRTELVTVPAVGKSFQAHGLAVPPDEAICSFFGRPAPEFHAWVRSLCPPGVGSEVIAAIDGNEMDLVSQAGELYPGVREALAELRASVGQMALCSNGRHAYVSRVLDAHGLEPFFDVVRHRESGRDNKPRMVLELLGRLKSRPALVIGDRSDDIEAAHQNGLRAIAATYGYGKAEELQAADATARCPSDLPDLVRRLLAEKDGQEPGIQERPPVI